MEADRSAQLVQRAQRFAAHRIDSVPAQGYAGELPLARAKADQSFWLLARSSAASVCKGTSMFKSSKAEAGLISRPLSRYDLPEEAHSIHCSQKGCAKTQEIKKRAPWPKHQPPTRARPLPL